MAGANVLIIDILPVWLNGYAIHGVAVLAVALAYDLLLGELPTAIHPVVWVGRLISLLERLAPQKGSGSQLVYGSVMVLGVVVALAAAVWGLLAYLGTISAVAQILMGAFILKASFSLRELMAAAGRVQLPLAANDLAGARQALRSLVSRDTSRLSRPLLAAAAVESVAENTSDSVLAPLLYFAMFGPPGAFAYRTINTFDSMIGYHGKYEYLGRFAARLDDAANWLPARATALLIVAGARLSGLDARRAWRIMDRHHGRTESPNAGWPMSAMAGALGVVLEKLRHYRLGEDRAPVTPATIGQAIAVAWRANALGIIIIIMVRLLVSARFP
jgi:adenosylcobinamide-phosphate synthase